METINKRKLKDLKIQWQKWKIHCKHFSSLKVAEEKSRELEDKSVEIIQSEGKKRLN